MAPRSRELVLDKLDDLDDGEVVLWVDRSPVELRAADLRPEALVAAAVFAAPITVQTGVELRDTHMLGFRQQRDGILWVFLEEVRCASFTTLPDTVAVFAGGLCVAGIANFAARDATTFVEGRLQAAVVLSGMGDGAVSIVPGTALEIGSFCSYLGSAAPLEDVVDADLFAEIEESAAWEALTGELGPPLVRG
ncbi:MAG: hypothetical protein KC621_13465 [Myxococcales bacterium]|nr:hypothetical protein [Myxococcales bacterium]